MLERSGSLHEVETDVNPVVQAARVVARLARIVEQECLDEGFGLSQYRILLFAARETQRAGTLASRSALTRPAVTAAVSGLVERGLLERREVPGDRRGIRLAVTRAGRAALARTEKQLATRLAELIGPGEKLSGVLNGLPVVERALDRELEREIAVQRVEPRRVIARR